MSNEQRAIEKEAIKIEMIEGLQRALNRSYRRFVQGARRDWERLFAGKDPSDACVSVSISGGQKALPGSAFLKPGKPSANEPRAKLPQRRLAH